MKLPLAALTLTLLLTACAGGSSSLTCPPVAAYSKAAQNKAADELLACNCPTVTEMMKDAKVMRDQSRVCRR